MATIAGTIRELQTAFAEQSISTPRLDAELLIGHVLGQNRTQLLANLRDSISDSDRAAINHLGQRRLAGEPIAYILGRKEFLGHDFVVGPAVLTPRPETELLVEWAVRWLAGRPGATVVDVGTGSGAIAIGVALGAPSTVSITALDISDAALAVARANADRICPGRIEFRAGDLLGGIEGPIELVLANLPYLRPDQIEENPDLAAEPRLALDGGRDGLALIQRLVWQLPAVLTRDGAAALEIDPTQSSRLADLLATALPDAAIDVHSDLAGHDRFVTAVRL